MSPRILDNDQGIKRLFDHPRFNVLFTRQGLMDPAALEQWARILIKRLGWNRILWGSEWPVALWRDETYESTKSYIDLFGPSAKERRLFFYENAMRLVFSKQIPETHPIDDKWDFMALKTQSAISLFPKGLILPEKDHIRLMRAYYEWGGEKRGTYSDFVRYLLRKSVVKSRSRISDGKIQ